MKLSKPADRFLYLLTGGYVGIHVLWMLTMRGMGIFDTALFMVVGLPSMALVSLVFVQVLKPAYRCSVLANGVAVIVIPGMAFLSLAMFAEASAAV